MPDSDLHKQREILFSRFPPGQIPEAASQLQQLEHLEAAPQLLKRAVEVSYDLREHTLEELETHLQDQGFHLDNTLMSKLRRALIHYVEDTQLHNLGVHERPLKQSQEAFIQAWERHPHGDHDETPPEWREYK